eukprot:1182160-Prorocentrum_minimum.AAC.2
MITKLLNDKTFTTNNNFRNLFIVYQYLPVGGLVERQCPARQHRLHRQIRVEAPVVPQPDTCPHLIGPPPPPPPRQPDR